MIPLLCLCAPFAADSLTAAASIAAYKCRAGWVARGSEPGVRRTGWVASGSELGAREARGSRIGAGGLLAGLAGGTRIGARRPADVACELEIGVVGRHDADRSWGPAQWWRVHRSGTGWVEPGNRRGPTQKVIACVSRGKSSPQRLFLKSMRH